MFGFYVTALFVSGIGVIVLALVTSELHPGRRVINGLIGTAFLSYGFYLAVFLHGGEYRIFLWVFILPFILLGQAMRTVEVPAPPGASSPDIDDHLVDPRPGTDSGSYRRHPRTHGRGQVCPTRGPSRQACRQER